MPDTIHPPRFVRAASSAMILVAACQTKPPGVELATPPSTAELAIPTTQAGVSEPQTPVAPAPVSPAPVASRVEPEASLVKVGFASVRRGARLPWEQAVEAGPEPAPTVWRLERTITVGVGYLYRALPTPDNLGIVTLSTRDGGLRYYERKSGQLLLRIDLPDYVEFEDADFVIVGERPLRVLVQRESGVVIYELDGSGPPRGVALPAGNLVRATTFQSLYGFADREVPSQTGSLSLQWLAENGTSAPAFDLRMSERPDAWALSTDGRRLAINYYPSNLTHLLDLERLLLLAEIESPTWGGSVAFSPSGNYLAVGGAYLALHAVAEGRLLATDKTYGNNIADVRFTPRGELLLVSAYDGKVRSYALPAGDALPERLPRPQLLRHAGTANVYGLGLSPDGRLLVTPSGDKTLKIWVR